MNTTNSAFDEEQGDLKIDFKATQKDSIFYRFTSAYQNNPYNNSQELLSNSLCDDADLQHGWRLEPHHRKHSGQRCPHRLESYHAEQW